MPKPPWQKRKEEYVAHLPEATPERSGVSCADKLHNARSLLGDYRRIGERLWERFTASRDETLWYYRSLVEVYRAHGVGLWPRSWSAWSASSSAWCAPAEKAQYPKLSPTLQTGVSGCSPCDPVGNIA